MSKTIANKIISDLKNFPNRVIYTKPSIGSPPRLYHYEDEYHIDNCFTFGLSVYRTDRGGCFEVPLGMVDRFRVWKAIRTWRKQA
jgi:hypothetical protein